MTMKRPRILRSIVAFAICIAVGVGLGLYAHAGSTVPVGLAYSGLLRDGNGTPVNGMHVLDFELTDGNATMCTDAGRMLAVTNGRFDVPNLFSVNNCALDAVLATKPSLLVKITVDGAPLSPAQPLGAVPYAARARVAEAGITGTIVATAAVVCPTGSLPADGSPVSRMVYANLFAQIGTTYGAGDSVMTFNVPDARGVFLRGAGSQAIGGVTHSGTLGMTQGDQYQGHWHQHWEHGGDVVPGGAGSRLYTTGFNTSHVADDAIRDAVSDGVNGAPRTGSETRPANISVTYCIWY
jgi:hypothetical protein